MALSPAWREELHERFREVHEGTVGLHNTPIKVNSSHPGAVATEANPGGTLSPAEGALTAVELALLPADGPTGGFFPGAILYSGDRYA